MAAAQPVHFISVEDREIFPLVDSMFVPADWLYVAERMQILRSGIVFVFRRSRQNQQQHCEQRCRQRKRSPRPMHVVTSQVRGDQGPCRVGKGAIRDSPLVASRVFSEHITRIRFVTPRSGLDRCSMLERSSSMAILALTEGAPLCHGRWLE